MNVKAYSSISEGVSKTILRRGLDEQSLTWYYLLSSHHSLQVKVRIEKGRHDSRRFTRPICNQMQTQFEEMLHITWSCTFTTCSSNSVQFIILWSMSQKHLTTRLECLHAINAFCDRRMQSMWVDRLYRI